MQSERNNANGAKKTREEAAKAEAGPIKRG